MEPETEDHAKDSAPVAQPASTGPGRKAKSVRRDPNEGIPENWQRRLHIADRMPPFDISEGVELSDSTPRKVTSKQDESQSYSVGDYAFFARTITSDDSFWDEDICAPPPTLKVGRIMDVNKKEVLVNWLVRPCDVSFKSQDTRELYLSFETENVSLENLRGRLTVQCRSDIRNLAKYRGKSSQFWYSKLYYAPFRKLFDVVPTLSMKSLGIHLLEELSLSANYAVLDRAFTKSLCEQPRKRKAAEDHHQEEESPMSEETLARLTEERTKWPFRYFKAEEREFCAHCEVPRAPKIGENHQLDIAEWPGKPLVYYTAVTRGGGRGGSTSSRRQSTTEIRLVEPHDTESSVDTSKPWVQEMPKGYIPRGGDATSTPVSVPADGLAQFVQKSQASYAESIEVHPSAVNFIDACCSIFIHNRDNIDDAFVTVSRLSRKQLREPDLQPNELKIFREALNPFKHRSWHEVYRAVASKPAVELCQFYWVNLPQLDHVPFSRLCVGKDPETGEDEEEENSVTTTKKAASASASETSMVCAICGTDHSPEWKALPGNIMLENKPEYEDASIALCARCARLWYRYRTSWDLPSAIEKKIEAAEEGKEDPKEQLLEPELIEDTKLFFAESERREKRRQAAQEKREALVKRRAEIKVAKKAAKEARKAGEEPAPDVQKVLEAAKEPEGKAIKAAKAAKEAELANTKAGKAAKDVKKPKAESKRAASATTDAGEPKTKKAKLSAAAKDKNSKSAAAAEPASSKPAEADEEAENESSDEESDHETTTRGRKKPVGSQLSLDQVEEILDAIEADPPNEASEHPNYCAVCGQYDPSMPQETCVSCGLTVHTACYGGGAYLDSKDDASSAWLCDCCLNYRGKLQNDQSYQCNLCPPRAPSYEQWLNGTSTPAPDALKGTTAKSWCHVRCALFTPGVRFGNPVDLSDIDLTGVNEEQFDGHCKICLNTPPQPRNLVLPLPYSKESSGPSKQESLAPQPQTPQPQTPQNLANGDHAEPEPLPETADPPSTNGVPATAPATDGDSKSLISPKPINGTDKNELIAANNSHSTSSSSSSRSNQLIPSEARAAMGSKVRCEFCDDRFHVSCAADQGYSLGILKGPSPRPVIVCNKHRDVNIESISKIDTNMNLSNMQLLVGTHKAAPRTYLLPAERILWNRRRERDAGINKKSLPLILPLLDQNSENSQRRFASRDWLLKHEGPLKCASCGKDNASYWHETAPNTVVCPLCFAGITPMGSANTPPEIINSFRAALAEKTYRGLIKSLPQDVQGAIYAQEQQQLQKAQQQKAQQQPTQQQPTQQQPAQQQLGQNAAN